MGPSLYLLLGGEEAIDALVLRFYRKVMTDPRVAGFFDGVDMAKQTQKQKAFLTHVLGGPLQYNGRQLREAHARLDSLGLNHEHFDIVAGHLQATLEEMGVSPHEIRQVMQLVAATRRDVIKP